MNKNMNIIEGLLFLSGDNGITIGELVAVLNSDQMSIEEEIKNLINFYMTNNHAFTIIETAQTYKLVTTPENSEYYEKYANIEFNDKLSKSALETLAIIAYNQPMTRFQIEEIRGVMSGHNLKNLISHELIKVVGRSKEIGKPNLYGTTQEMLDMLGINSLEELPSLSEFDLTLDKEQESLFDSEQDFKEIRKRLLSSDNIFKIDDAPEFDDLDKVEIKEPVFKKEKELEKEQQESDKNESN